MNGDVGGDVSSDVSDGVFDSVRDGYDAVYEALGAGPTFGRIWRQHAYRGEFPVEFSHIGFLTLNEADRVVAVTGLREGQVVVDVACGAGGPGLWIAQATGAELIGIDPSRAGLAAARQRAAQVGMDRQARFEQGTFEATGLPDGTADAVISIEAFQYAPDKRAAIAELRRVLRPGGVLAIVCFEVDPDRVAGIPVLGVDPIPDYAPLLEDAGFTVVTNEETPGWEERVHGAFGALVEAQEALIEEMGERAAAGVVTEAMLTVQLRPYPRRVLVAARRAG